MKDILLLIAACYVTLHGPSGNDAIKVDAASIFIIRAATPEMQRHVVKGVNTFVYVSGEKFGVSETVEEVEALVRGCQQDEEITPP